MSGPGNGTRDDELEGELRAVARLLDPVPVAAIAAARASYTWRTVDTELALLRYDSATEELTAAGVRGDGARLLAFEADGVSIDVEVTASGGTYSLVGQVSTPVRLEVRRPSETMTAEVDASGGFALSGLEPGSVSFRCVITADGDRGERVVCTDWVTL